MTDFEEAPFSRIKLRENLSTVLSNEIPLRVPQCNKIIPFKSAKLSSAHT